MVRTETGDKRLDQPAVLFEREGEGDEQIA